MVPLFYRTHRYHFDDRYQRCCSVHAWACGQSRARRTMHLKIQNITVRKTFADDDDQHLVSLTGQCPSNVGVGFFVLWSHTSKESIQFDSSLCIISVKLLLVLNCSFEVAQVTPPPPWSQESYFMAAFFSRGSNISGIHIWTLVSVRYWEKMSPHPRNWVGSSRRRLLPRPGFTHSTSRILDSCKGSLNRSLIPSSCGFLAINFVGMLQVTRVPKIVK